MMPGPLQKPPFRLHSPAFSYGELIPRRYTCDGDDINPPLTIENTPRETKSLMLVLEDPDSPGGKWIHWRLWNIDKKTTTIRENSVPKGAIVGPNTWGKRAYGGPCPRSGEHSYIFRLYALREEIELIPEASDLMIETIMLGKVVAETDLVGYYHRVQPT